MDQSPLTLQARPDFFEPKIVQLYRLLFRVRDFFIERTWPSLSDIKDPEDEDKPEGFWRELFLLKPDVYTLAEIVDNTDADFLLQVQVDQSQTERSERL